MTDLITRLSKLDAPDREVDVEIMSLFYVRGKRHIGAYTENDFGVDEPVDSDVWIDPKTDRWVSTSAHCFTGSLDAVTALARRFHPDVMYRVGNDGEGPDPSLYLGEIFIPGEQKDSYFTGHSPVDAVSLCIALLRAKEASNDE